MFTFVFVIELAFNLIAHWFWYCLRCTVSGTSYACSVLLSPMPAPFRTVSYVSSALSTPSPLSPYAAVLALALFSRPERYCAS
eukprot:48057-Rhodomonas_salina.1